MTEQHLDDILIPLLDRRPFRPFSVELVGGERFQVDHAHAIALSSEGVAVHWKPGTIPVYFDHDSVVQIIDDIAGTKPRKSRRNR